MFIEKRIKKYEKIFDELSFKLQHDSECFLTEKNLIKKVKSLEKYYNSRLWKMDFEADEQGRLPSDLKRGILSEDGIYNLLCQIHSLKIIDKA